MRRRASGSRFRRLRQVRFRDRLPPSPSGHPYAFQSREGLPSHRHGAFRNRVGGRQAIIGCPASGSRKCVDAVLDLLSASQWRLVVTCGLRLRVVLVDGQGAAIGAFRFEILLQAMKGRAEIAERNCVVRL